MFPTMKSNFDGILTKIKKLKITSFSSILVQAVFHSFLHITLFMANFVRVIWTNDPMQSLFLDLP